MSWILNLLYRPFWIKLLHWEYWPFSVVYTPIYPIWFLLCARARSFFFFAASNPTIKNGGFLMETKKEIYDLIPQSLHPATALFQHQANPQLVLETLTARQFRYPLIGKPNIGFRGVGVRKLNNEAELVQYCRDSPVDFLIQEYIPYEQEIGIFYYRFPWLPKGRITGIVRKEFPSVTGDGKSSIRQLVMQEKRLILQMKSLEKMYGPALEEVLQAGESKELVSIGNHARGSKFLDDSALIDAQLEAQLDRICSQIDGFYYGRLDIRFDNWEQLKKGEAFSIIEVNGAGAEPTHMYDPKHSVFYAWKEIIRHWFILFRISRYNHRKGARYLSFREGTRMFRDSSSFEKKMKELYA